MKLQKPFHIIVLIQMIFLFGCKNDDFSPIKGYENNITSVYSTLDSRFNTQFVKIQKSYFDKFTNDSNKTNLGKVSVKIYSNGITTILKDTNITDFPEYKVFYTPNLKIESASSYNLYIQAASSQKITSSTITPKPLYITFKSSLDSIRVALTINDAIASAIHMYVEYSKSVDGNIVIDRVEVPIQISIKGNDTNFYYPEIYKKNENNQYVKIIKELFTSYEIIGYRKDYIKIIKSQISKTKGFVEVRKGYVLVFSYDSAFWYYYNSVKGFDDPYSIRMDSPNWTNINNGSGFFGSVIVDSAKFNLP
jgi:hypothetical protein